VLAQPWFFQASSIVHILTGHCQLCSIKPSMTPSYLVWLEHGSQPTCCILITALWKILTLSFQFCVEKPQVISFNWWETRGEISFIDILKHWINWDLKDCVFNWGVSCVSWKGLTKFRVFHRSNDKDNLKNYVGL